MADTKEQDPSIEEILASIRQIISDDDAQPENPPAEEVQEEPKKEEPKDDVFELTKDMQEPDDSDLESEIEETLEDALENVKIDFKKEDNNMSDDLDEDTIFTDVAADATTGAFSKLKETVALSHHSDNVTLEEIVKDMLRPMLREWIDGNMPRLVEVLVEKELEKLARHTRDM